ncbi:MAG TPA: hypothetical protein VGK73_17630, partial [Polyangiaceae bacterium]
KRAVLSSLFQFSWRNGTFYVHSAPKEVIFKLDRTARADAEKLLHMAETHGLLDAKAPPEVGAASSHSNVARL